MARAALIGLASMALGGCAVPSNMVQNAPANTSTTVPKLSPEMIERANRELSIPQISVWTNGQKEVRFVEMIHVARPTYYQRVREQINAAGRERFTLLYEGVRFNTLDDTGLRKVRKLVGVMPDPKNYAKGPWREIYAQLGGEAPVQQDNASFMGLGTVADINLDMDGREFLATLEAAVGRIELTKVDLETPLDEAVPPLPNGNAIIDTVVLAARNEKLVDAIMDRPERGFIILYGAAHREPLFRQLSQRDKRWTIVSQPAGIE